MAEAARTHSSSLNRDELRSYWGLSCRSAWKRSLDRQGYAFKVLAFKFIFFTSGIHNQFYSHKQFLKL